jgi:hypothetical protein
MSPNFSSASAILRQPVADPARPTVIVSRLVDQQLVHALDRNRFEPEQAASQFDAQLRCVQCVSIQHDDVHA